jgi:rhomboid protease GluP
MAREVTPMTTTKPLAPYAPLSQSTLVNLDSDGELVRCGVCGALNGRDFDRCIRCASRLGAGSPSDEPNREPGLPWATWALAGLCILVQVVELAWSARGKEGLAIASAPRDVAVALGALVVEPTAIAAEPWRLVSAGFVHFGVVHALFNLLTLRNVGSVTESLIGPWRMVILYVATAVVGFVTSAVPVWFGGKVHFTAGASGAVFGVMGALLALLVRARDPRWRPFAVQGVLLTLLLTFAMGAAVNHLAHLGGLASGFALGALFGMSSPNPRTARWGGARNRATPLPPAGGVVTAIALALAFVSLVSLALAPSSELTALVRGL